MQSQILVHYTAVTTKLPRSMAVTTKAEMILMLSILLLSTTWFVRAEEGPVFKIVPSSSSDREGDQIILSCTVDINTLSEGQEVVWRRDNEIISRGINVIELYRDHFELNGNSASLGMYTLVIPKASRSDGNYGYSCAVVEGNTILTETDPVTLTINALPAPQYPDCTLVKDQHREGEMITLICTSEKVTPPVNLRWYHRGKLISNPREGPASNGDLVNSQYSFKPTRKNNGDVYVCSQTSSLQVTRNCTVGPLDILHEPSVSMQPAVEVQEGSEALLVCYASANPEPFLYEWTFVPNIDPTFYKLENTDQVVRITNVRQYMNGTKVTCKVANKIGAVQANSYLIVKEALNLVDPPVVQTVGNAEPNNRVINSTAILSVAGGLLLFTALLVGVSLCYFHMCKRGMQIYESPFRIAQPEVYFEPKDNVPPLPLYPREGVYLKRHVAIQVSPDMDDESVYAEIEEVSYKKMMRYSSATYSH
ncbi:uncharacterized protein LOC117116887 [Anneissia japonica]|uniref:uncharacterized protein LOC117116887 n=1 Tax=Anneissia japonica TaxID=1529436 RepID=UPI00142557D4|nr:uncharacterized protein LOC117116887 [Anneissia japonica]